MNKQFRWPIIATLVVLSIVLFARPSCCSDDTPGVTTKVTTEPKTWQERNLDRRKATSIENCELILNGTPLIGKHIIGCKLPNGKNRALMAF